MLSAANENAVEPKADVLESYSTKIESDDKQAVKEAEPEPEAEQPIEAPKLVEKVVNELIKELGIKKLVDSYKPEKTKKFR